jgi:hypothetical protein
MLVNTFYELEKQPIDAMRLARFSRCDWEPAFVYTTHN